MRPARKSTLFSNYYDAVEIDKYLETLQKEQEKQRKKNRNLLEEREKQDKEISDLIKERDKQRKEITDLLDEREKQNNQISDLLKKCEKQENEISDLNKKLKCGRLDDVGEPDQYDFEVDMEVWRKKQKEENFKNQVLEIPLYVVNEMVFRQTKAADYLVCGVIGEYNCGKTWFINKLCETNLPSGFSELGATRKIGFKVMTKFPILFIDTPGLRAPYPVLKEAISKEIKDYDKLIAHALVYLCDFPIFVVSTLTADQQHFLIDTIFACHNLKQQKATKVMIIIHNYSRITSKSEVEETFNFYVRPYFGKMEKKHFYVREGTDQGLCYCSTFSYSKNIEKTILVTEEYDVMHLVFAREGSEAGEYFNPKAVDALRNVFNGNISTSRPYNVIERFNKFIEQRTAEFKEPKFELKETIYKLNTVKTDLNV